MIDARESSELVHVLRHSFSPSEKLQSTLETFTKPGLLRPRFLIKTLSGIALSKVDVADNRFEAAIQEASASFEAERIQPLQLGSSLAARRMGDGALRILLASESHSTLMGLVRRSRQYFPGEIMLNEGEDERFDLFVQIDESLAVSQEQVIRSGLSMRDKLHREYRYQLNMTPAAIVGEDEIRTIIRMYEEEDKAS